jgi:hypothetical protein
VTCGACSAGGRWQRGQAGEGGCERVGPAPSDLYISGASEIGPNGEMRPGYAHNVVTVEADTSDAAVAAVKGALGP